MITITVFPHGIYVIVVEAHGETEVGKLGKMKFNGKYAYLGSNQRGGRIERHLKKGKKKKWHIDYLTEIGKVMLAIIMPLGKEFEEKLAKYLSKKYEVIKGFGNSDCRDAGHLFVFRKEMIEDIKKFAEKNKSKVIIFEF